MCLNYSVECSSKLRSRMRKNGDKIVVYKVVYRSRSKRLYSRFFRDFYWKAGWNIAKLRHSDKKLYDKRPRIDGHAINSAIHVFLDEPVLSEYASPDVRILKLTAHLKDLIGADVYREAAFRRVFLKKADYERAIRS